MIGERTATFVWQCSSCSGAYDGEGLTFLYTDGDHAYCPCGGRLVEGVVVSADQRRYRLVIPRQLVGTSLHRRLETLLADDEAFEVAPGRRGDRNINLFSLSS